MAMVKTRVQRRGRRFRAGEDDDRMCLEFQFWALNRRGKRFPLVMKDTEETRRRVSTFSWRSLCFAQCCGWLDRCSYLFVYSRFSVRGEDDIYLPNQCANARFAILWRQVTYYSDCRSEKNPCVEAWLEYAFVQVKIDQSHESRLEIDFRIILHLSITMVDDIPAPPGWSTIFLRRNVRLDSF